MNEFESEDIIDFEHFVNIPGELGTDDKARMIAWKDQNRAAMRDALQANCIIVAAMQVDESGDNEGEITLHASVEGKTSVIAEFYFQLIVFLLERLGAVTGHNMLCTATSVFQRVLLEAVTEGEDEQVPDGD